MAGKRRRLISWRCGCCNPRFARTPMPIPRFQDHPGDEVESTDGWVHVDTHVHINEVFMRLQISEEVPSQGKLWDDMSEAEQQAWTVLGFDRASWAPLRFNGSQPDKIATWKACMTKYGSRYYYNNQTGEMTWDRPADFKEPGTDVSDNNQTGEMTRDRLVDFEDPGPDRYNNQICEMTRDRLADFEDPGPDVSDNNQTGEMTRDRLADLEDLGPDVSCNENDDSQASWQMSTTRFGSKYYYNTQTGETTWELPADVDGKVAIAFSEERSDASVEASESRRNTFGLEWAELLPHEREAAIAVGYTQGTPAIPSEDLLRCTVGPFACITTGCDPDSLEQTLSIHKSIPLAPRCPSRSAPCDSFPGFVWASLGCHPKTAALFSLANEPEAFLQLDAFEVRLRAVASEMRERLIAWGEVGLDYSHPLFGSNRFNQWFQQQAFERQVKMGMEFNLPLVIHARDAFEDTMRILRELVPSEHPLHLHCTWEPPSAISEFLTSFPKSVIGVTNNVFYPGDVPEQLCQCVPIEHLVLETDAPYLPPGGSDMSHMGNIASIGRKVAEIRGVSFRTVMEAVRQNVSRVYGI